LQLVSGEIQCSRVRIGSMPTLGELPAQERKELARSLAKDVWDVVEHHGELDGVSLEDQVFHRLEWSGLLHESNFCTNLNKRAQVAKLKEFHDTRQKTCDCAEQYDKDVANGVEKMAPGFARKSDELRRTYLTVHIMRELCNPDSPFATLRTADAIDDQDRSDESNDDDDHDDDDVDYDVDGGEESEDSEESDSDSDCEANKVLDKADEEDASDGGSDSDSDSGSASGSGSGSEELPSKRKKLERTAATPRIPAPPTQACTGDDSDLSDA
jgi:hypothetical protein